MTRMAAVTEWLFFGFIATIIIVVIYVAILWKQSPPQLVLEGRVENTKVKAGADLVIHNRFAEPINCASWWHRYVYDSNGMQVLGFSEFRPAGASQEYKRTIRIPDGSTKPGKATYQSTIFWECNWIQHIWPHEVDLPSIEIEIVK